MRKTYARTIVWGAVAWVSVGNVAMAMTPSASLQEAGSQDRAELQAKLREIQLPAPDGSSQEAAERRAALLEGADANGDGLLTKLELEAHLSSLFGRMDRNDDGVVSMKDAPRFARQRFQEKVGPIIARTDSNGDDAMSYDEFSAAPLSRFAELDKGDTGAVDIDAMIGDRAEAEQTG